MREGKIRKKMKRDISLGINREFDLSDDRPPVTNEAQFSLTYDDPDVVAKDRVVYDNWTMRQLIAHLDALLPVVLQRREQRVGIQYLRPIRGINVFTTLDPRGKEMDRLLSELIPVTGNRRADRIIIDFNYKWVLGKENELPYNMSNVGCNHCGSRPTSPDTKMMREKTGARRLFCHKECQKNFYSGVFSVDIEEATANNSNFRTVLYTTLTQQLVLMSISPEDREIGEEVHTSTTQLLRVESGKGVAVVDGVSIQLKQGTLVVINPGAKHNIINEAATSDLKLYTVYSPPNHAPWTLHVRRGDSQE